MDSGKNVIKERALAIWDPVNGRRLLADAIRCTGLTPAAREVHKLAEELPKRLAVFYYKQLMPSLWLVFVGGTGTGKSTLFNAFCGKPLSETGMERPVTRGPIAYVHRECLIEEGFPFGTTEVARSSSEGSHFRPITGTPGDLLVLEHDRKDWSHLIAVDTPDLDSVEATNRRIAADLYLLSDAVVFVTSQEKYADEIPYQFLLGIIQEKTPYFVLVNKARDGLTQQDVLETVGSQGLSFRKGRVWLIPYVSANPSQQISEHQAFRDFATTCLRELATKETHEFREAQLSRRAEDLKIRCGRLLTLLEEENKAAQKWLARLQDLYQQTSEDLVTKEKERFMAKSRNYIRPEIRRLFTRYDILAKPRWLIREVFLSPLRLLGFVKESKPETHKGALLKVRKKIDLSPIETAIERFNRLVLEDLSPSDKHSPLFKALRQPRVVLNDEEIKQHISNEQDQLAAWLEDTFQRLSQGISKDKEWGIYYTSILWGVLIVSFEIAIGGGFSILDVVLDSAIAPFVTKGTVEIFAYHEIQKVARELGRRYQNGLLNVLRDQRDRYTDCLQALVTPGETLQALQLLYGTIVNENRHS